jgi:hypothetical protein
MGLRPCTGWKRSRKPRWIRSFGGRSGSAHRAPGGRAICPLDRLRLSTTLLVELGTHGGVSFSAFCQAVARANLDTRCYAIDTWLGDAHTGFCGEDIFADRSRLHDQRYASFSTPLRSFDDALSQFVDGTVDLLHIDGLQTYEAVRHDFESWRPKLSERGIVMFHDTNERSGDFGVWRLFNELREQFPSFEFLHGHGLGVLAVGNNMDPTISALCELSDPLSVARVRARFAVTGERWSSETRERLLAQELDRCVGQARGLEERMREHERMTKDYVRRASTWPRTMHRRTNRWPRTMRRRASTWPTVSTRHDVTYTRQTCALSKP